MSIICFIKGCDWVACAVQIPLMTCERCERCGTLRYHHIVAH
ncbi:PSPA7_2676 family Cys-rich small protein [Pseudomonas putida]